MGYPRKCRCGACSYCETLAKKALDRKRNPTPSQRFHSLTEERNKRFFERSEEYSAMVARRKTPQGRRRTSPQNTFLAWAAKRREKWSVQADKLSNDLRGVESGNPQVSDLEQCDAGIPQGV